MCGIAGFVCSAGHSPSLVRLQAAAAALSHRGPDGHGTIVHEHVGLAHARLSIIDLSSGHQPLESQDGTYCLVANGEIYNYRELQAAWQARGGSLRTHSDSECLLFQSQLLGIEEGVKTLNGMFAFALHNRRTGVVTLGVDRMGIKPLYYIVTPQGIAFASEIKGFLPLIDQRPEIHAPALLQYFQNGYHFGEESILKNVKRVLPGELIHIDPTLRLTRKQYWSLLDVTPQQYTLHEAEEVFNPLFRTVMQEHMRADVPFGLFLSGGVDSSLLCAALAENGARNIQTYTLGYTASPSRNELSDAELIAKQFDTRHTTLEIDSTVLRNVIPLAVWSNDDLMGDTAILPTCLLAHRASANLKVVFTGEGGDEAFAGYGRHQLHQIQRFFLNFSAPGTGGYAKRPALRPKEIQRYLGNALFEEMKHQFVEIGEIYRKVPRDWGCVRKAQYIDCQTELYGGLLVKLDRCLMSSGLEGRVPFLDHRIMNFGLSLPSNLKITKRQRKYFLRQWGTQFIPKDHLTKPKRGFHVPMSDLFQPEILTKLIAHLKTNSVLAQWLQPAALAMLLEQYQHDPKRHNEVLIWRITQFAVWHAMYLQSFQKRPTISENIFDYL